MASIALLGCDLAVLADRSNGLGVMLGSHSGPPPSPRGPAVSRTISSQLVVHLVTPIQCPHCKRKPGHLFDLRLPRSC